MLIASLFALALAAADTPQPQAAPAEPAREARLPAGAPEDDYGFVAWCHGALSGHMELYNQVKDDLDVMSPPPPGNVEATRQAGEMYLGLYSRAMEAAEKASPTVIRPRAQQASARGYSSWTAVRAAATRDRTWAYVNWELPPRCEIAAKRLEERSPLFAEALRQSPVAVPDRRPVASSDAGAPGQGLRGTQ